MDLYELTTFYTQKREKKFQGVLFVDVELINLGKYAKIIPHDQAFFAPTVAFLLR